MLVVADQMLVTRLKDQCEAAIAVLSMCISQFMSIVIRFCKSSTVLHFVTATFTPRTSLNKQYKAPAYLYALFMVFILAMRKLFTCLNIKEMKMFQYFFNVRCYVLLDQSNNQSSSIFGYVMSTSVVQYDY